MNKDEEIKKLKQQIEELIGKWKRALADYQNLEKRVVIEKEDFIKYANAGLILKFLNILDILEKAAEHLKDKGFELALSEFKKILKDEGIQELMVKPEDKFNHNEMECLEVVKGNEVNDGKVAAVGLKGYKLNGKILRTAKVKVYRREI